MAWRYVIGITIGGAVGFVVGVMLQRAGGK